MILKKLIFFNFILLTISMLFGNFIYSNELSIQNKTEVDLELEIKLTNKVCPESILLRLGKDNIIKLFDPLLSHINEINYYKSGILKKHLSLKNTLYEKKQYRLSSNGRNLNIILKPNKKLEYKHGEKSENSTIENFVETKLDNVFTDMLTNPNAIEDHIRKPFGITSKQDIYSLTPIISHLANIIGKNQEQNTIKSQRNYLNPISMLYTKMTQNIGLDKIIQFKNCLKSLSNNVEYKNNIEKLFKVFEISKESKKYIEYDYDKPTKQLNDI